MAKRKRVKRFVIDVNAFISVFIAGHTEWFIYLTLTREEIKGKLSSGSLFASGTDSAFYKKIVLALSAFAENPAPGTVTYRDIIYRKDLMRELEDIENWPTQPSMFSGLTQLLIYLNYNDKEYINDLVNSFVGEMAGLNDANDKIDRLRLYFKILNQLPSKPDSALHVKHLSVKTQLNDWIAEELYYQEKKLGQLQRSLPAKTAPASSTKLKVVCH